MGQPVVAGAMAGVLHPARHDPAGRPHDCDWAGRGHPGERGQGAAPVLVPLVSARGADPGLDLRAGARGVGRIRPVGRTRPRRGWCGAPCPTGSARGRRTPGSPGSRLGRRGARRGRAGRAAPAAGDWPPRPPGSRRTGPPRASRASRRRAGCGPARSRWRRGPPRGVEQLGHALDSDDTSAPSSASTATLVAAAGADIEHLPAGTDPRELRHPRDDVRLADGLTVPDWQRQIRERLRAELGRDEAVARHGAHGAQDLRIDHVALRDGPLDQVLEGEP